MHILYRDAGMLPHGNALFDGEKVDGPEGRRPARGHALERGPRILA